MDSLEQANRNRLANAVHFCAITQLLSKSDQVKFETKMMSSFFAMLEPTKFKALCEMVSAAMDVEKLQDLSSDPNTVN
jgi:hypothetical protein